MQYFAAVDPPNNDPAKNLNCVAFQAVNTAYPQTTSQTLEYGGFIVKKPDQTYYYTPAFAGSQISMGSNFYTQYNNLVLSLQKGASVAGWYHDHPIGPPRYDPEHMSDGDRGATNYVGGPGFTHSDSPVLACRPSRQAGKSDSDKALRVKSMKTEKSLAMRQVIAILALAISIVCGLCGRVNCQEVSRKGFIIPKEGFVPTADVAITIAEAVLVPVYGRDVIRSERPFHATLKGDLWVVSGTVPCEGAPKGAVCPGGNAEVRISKKTGRIVYMMHSM